MKNLILITSVLFTSSLAHAISEKDYQNKYSAIVKPFLDKVYSQAFTFDGFDACDDDRGAQLSAVKILHPAGTAIKGIIVILPGRSEPWLKYGEVFYDLYQRGYDLYSYDHRGQGLSRHYSESNPQIGDVGYFDQYVRDLEVFMDKVVPESTRGKLYLLGHSMGGAIAAEYLSLHAHVFNAAVLSAPMLQINTKPYPEFVGRLITGLITDFGGGEKYALGQTDYDPNMAFDDKRNTASGSPDRFWMQNLIYKNYDKTLIGGASSRWVKESIRATHVIRKGMKNIEVPFLLLQAMSDQIVKLKGQNTGCANTPMCTKIQFEGSQHEILMERDFIRDAAMADILDFFGKH